MIGQIIDLLNLDTFYGVSRNIDIAKGSGKIPMSYKEAIDQFKRNRAWRKE